MKKELFGNISFVLFSGNIVKTEITWHKCAMIVFRALSTISTTCRLLINPQRIVNNPFNKPDFNLKSTNRISYFSNFSISHRYLFTSKTKSSKFTSEIDVVFFVCELIETKVITVSRFQGP